MTAKMMVAAMIMTMTTMMMMLTTMMMMLYLSQSISIRLSRSALLPQLSAHLDNLFIK